MSPKVGRNEPCPCGSGRKYKHCHGRLSLAPEPAEDSHEGAIERAMAWLGHYHRKAFGEAVQQEIVAAAQACFGDDEEEAAFAALDDLSDDVWQQVQINLSEWVIAEGGILVRGKHEDVADLLLGPRGPQLSAGQRDWIGQLAREPLRMYDITEVRPGEGLTLCDAIDGDRPPVFVVEIEGSRSLRAGMAIGARLMSARGERVLSGALYAFSTLAAGALRQRLKSIADDARLCDEDRASMTGLVIIEDWLAQFLLPMRLPEMVDASTGEPLLLTTDHYDVKSWPALEAALQAQPDVAGDAQRGWSRLVTGDDGLQRPVVSVKPAPRRQRVSVSYKTAGHADRGRPWFEQLAGDAVAFVVREVSDPEGLLRGLEAGDLSASGASLPLPEGIDPEVLGEAVAALLKRSYANWADEPIPALDGRTPREAIATPAGLERVKGLLRSYEDGEAELAARQGRSPMSYQFLWDALGLER